MRLRRRTQSDGNEGQGVSAETLGSISTPDRVESRLGTLEFRDGAPSEATAERDRAHLTAAARQGDPPP